MIKSELPQPGEIELPRGVYPVLNNVSTLQGEYIGKTIITDILEQPVVQPVALRDIFGPPIAGKSTFLNGIANAVQSNATRFGIDIRIQRVLYEDVLGRFEKECEESNPALLNFLEGPKFNQRLSEEVDAIVQEALKSQKKTLILIENPGVGKTDVKDRGVSANDYILRRYITEGVDGIDAKAFSLLPEKGLETRGAFIRTTLNNRNLLDFDEIIDFLNKNNVILQTNRNESLQTTVNRFKIAMRTVATQEQTDSIFDEEVELLKQFQLTLTTVDSELIDNIVAPSYLASAKVLMSTSVNGQEFKGYDAFVEKRARDIQGYEKDWAFFYQHRMLEKGVPPNKGIVLFNPYLENTVFYLRI